MENVANIRIRPSDGEERKKCKVHNQKFTAPVKSSSDESTSESVEDLSSSYSDWARHHHSTNNPILEETRTISPTRFDNHIAEIKELYSRIMLADEQERVQKKTFVNWINAYLSKRDAALKINDLTSDLRDGTKLLALLEILSGEKLATEKGSKLRRPHFLSNVNTALQFLQSKKIKLVNINSTDFVDGKATVVLGLIWTIILYFQIEEGTRELSSFNSYSDTNSCSVRSSKCSSPVKNIKVESPKKTLLKWVNKVLPRDYAFFVQDFGLVWRDGILFLHLINALKPHLVAISSLETMTNRQRLEIAFTTAEQHLGIHRLLDPEDVDVNRPDERSVMTYVAQFAYKYLKLAVHSEESPSNMREPYQKLVRWLNDRTRELDSLQRNSDSYSDYVVVSKEMELYSSLMQQLRTGITSEEVFTNVEPWSNIEKRWLLLETQLSKWRWILDSSLLPPMDRIANWFFTAENMMSEEDVPPYTMSEDAPFIIGRKLDEYKTFFDNLPNITAKLEEFKLTVPSDDTLTKFRVNYTFTRLREIVEKSQRHGIRLKFLDHKHCLLAFLNLTEGKLKRWTVKYGGEEQVQQLLDEFNDYVIENDAIREFNRAFTDIQNAATRFKSGTDIDKFLRDVANRWHAISMELFCTQNMLEEVVATWKQWRCLAVEVENWVDKSYDKLNLPEEEKVIYFQDLKTWQEKYLVLEDTVSFLVTISDDSVGVELKCEFTRISKKWKEIFDKLDEHADADIELQNRKKYYSLSEQFQKWIVKAERELNTVRLMNEKEIRNNYQELQNLLNEIDENEEILKSISRLIQSLIQNVCKEEIDEMMSTLNRDKESILRIRRLISLRTDFYEQLLIQYESLNEAQEEITLWLTQAENLLNLFSLEGGELHLQNSLENRKIFFAKIPYWESILASKSNQFQKILKFVDTGKNIEIDDYAKTISDLNSRFERIVCQAEEQEKTLEEAIRGWHNYHQIERIIQDWLQNARNLLTETENITQCSLEIKQKFFENATDNNIEELREAATELSKLIPLGEYEQVKRHVQVLRSSWKEINSKASLHMVQLEFSLNLASFNYIADEIRKELNSEQQAFSHSADVEGLAKRHQDYFNYSNERITQGKELLNKLNHVCALYGTLVENSNGEYLTLKETCENAEQNWKITLHNIDIVRCRLSQVVEKWIAYRRKIDEISEWMYSVEESIRAVLQRVTATGGIENEKSVFQNICRDVDKKREDMQWLIQTFDSLSQLCSCKEQEELQSLTERYKSLLPTIEVTITRMDSFSKYYTYRKQIVQVSHMLEKIQEEVNMEPLSTESIDKQISQLQEKVDFLDKRHSDVMSVIQQEKKLLMETEEIGGGTFSKMVITFESDWNDVYSKANETLKTLKEAQKMLYSYQQHKESVLLALHKFENVFQKASQKYSNSLQVETELKAKRLLKEELCNSVNCSYLSLEDLSRCLPHIATSTHQRSQAQEIDIFKRKLAYYQTEAEKNIEVLKNLHTSWSNLEYNVEQIHTWVTVTAPASINTIEADTLTLEERVKIDQQLKNECDSITSLLENARENFEFLIAFIEEPQKIEEKLKFLHSLISDMNQRISILDIQLQKQLIVFKESKKEMEELVSWTEKVTGEFEITFATPHSVMNIDNQLEAAKKLMRECEEWQKKLHVLSQIEKENHFYLDSDTYASQLRKVQLKVDNEVMRIQKLQDLWTKLEKESINIKIRLEQLPWNPDAETQLEENTDLPTLRSRLADLKNVVQNCVELDNECTELGNVFSILNNDFSARAINEKQTIFNSLQKRCKNVYYSARESINLLSKTIALREVLERETETLSLWLLDIDSVVSNVVDVNHNNLDEELQHINLLIREFEEKQSFLNAIQKKIASKVDEEVSVEPKLIVNQYKSVEKNYQALRTKLFDKKMALERLKALDDWYLGIRQRILEIKYMLEADQCPKNVEDDLVEVHSEINSHRGDFGEIKSLCQIGKINAAYVYDICIFIDEMEHEVDNFKAVIAKKEEKKINALACREDFLRLKERFSVALADCKKYIQFFAADTENSDSSCPEKKNIVNLEEKLSQVNCIKDDLREKMSLLSDDNPSVTEIQEIVSSIHEWDILQEQINRRQQPCSTSKQILINQQDNQTTVMEMSNETEETLTETNEYASNSTQGDVFPEQDKDVDIQITDEELQEELSPCSGDTSEKRVMRGEIVSAVNEEDDAKEREENVMLLQEDTSADQEQATICDELHILLETPNSKFLEIDNYRIEIETWLNNSENLINAFHMLKSSLEEKRTALEQFQVHLETLFDRQKDVDELNIKAQELFNESANVEILNTTTLTYAKYNALLSVAKETMRKLELHYQEHQQLNSLCQECSDIVFRIKEKITECQELPTTVAEITSKMQMLKTIQHMFKQAENRLQYAAELREKVSSNTEPSGVGKIMEDTDTLKQEFEKLTDEVQELEQKLSARVIQLEEINKLRLALEEWLDEIEENVAREQENESIGDLTKNIATCEKFKLILADIAQHADTIEELKNLLKSNNSCCSTEPENIFSRYSDVRKRVAEMADELNQQIMQYEKYKDAYGEAQNWLKNTKSAIQHLTDSPGTKSQVSEKMNQLSRLKKYLFEGNQLMENAKKVGTNIMKTENKERTDNDDLDIVLLQNEFTDIQKLLEETDNFFSECIFAWDKFDVTLKTSQNWECDIRKKIENIDNRNLESISLENMNEYLALRNEVMGRNVFIEELRNSGEKLVELTAYTPVRDEIQDIQNTYTSLSTKVQNLLQNIEMTISHHADFVKIKTEFQEWMTDIRKLLQDCTGNGDQLWLDEKLRTVASIFDKMGEGEDLCRGMQKILANTLNNIPLNHRDSLINETSNLEQEWNFLKNELNSVKINLEISRNRWNEFDNLIKDLKEWLLKIKDIVDGEYDTKADITIMKTLREQFSEINEELTKKSSQIEYVTQEGDVLVAWSPNSKINESVSKVKSEWQRLLDVCSKRALLLESEITDYSSYHHALEDVEKWISQMSIRLMEPTSLRIVDKDQIEQLISQHNSIILQQIESYQANINDFKRLANERIIRYEPSIPIIRKSVEQLLNRVQDDYNSFLKTGREIKAGLENALSQFQKYEESVQSVESSLDELEEATNIGTANIPTDLDGCKLLLKSIQDLCENVQTEKTKLHRAVQMREAVVTEIVRPENYSFDKSSSTARDKETVVRIRLEDIGERLQNQLCLQSNNIVRWEEFNNAKNELIEWMKLQTIAITKWETKPLKLGIEANVADCSKIQDISITFLNKKEKLDQDKLVQDDELIDRLNSFEKLVQDALARQQKYSSDVQEFNKAVSTLNSHYNGILKEIDLINENKTHLNCEEKLKILNNINENFEADSKEKVLSVVQNAEKILEHIPDPDFKQTALWVPVREEMVGAEETPFHRITELEIMTGLKEKVAILQEQKILLIAVWKQLEKWSDIQECDAVLQKLKNIKSNIKTLINFRVECDLNQTRSSSNADISADNNRPEENGENMASQDLPAATCFPSEISTDESGDAEGQSAHHVTDSRNENVQNQVEECDAENDAEDRERIAELPAEEKVVEMIITCDRAKDVSESILENMVQEKAVESESKAEEYRKISTPEIEMTGQQVLNASTISDYVPQTTRSEEDNEHPGEPKQEHVDLNSIQFFVNLAVSDFELVRCENVEEVSFSEKDELFYEPPVMETEIIDPEQNNNIREELENNTNDIGCHDFATGLAVSQKSAVTLSTDKKCIGKNQDDNGTEMNSDLQQSEKNLFENVSSNIRCTDTALPTEDPSLDNYFNIEDLKLSLRNFRYSLSEVEQAVEDKKTDRIKTQLIHCVGKASNLFEDARSKIITSKASYLSSDQERATALNTTETLVLQIIDECVNPLLLVLEKVVLLLAPVDSDLFQGEEKRDRLLSAQTETNQERIGQIRNLELRLHSLTFTNELIDNEKEEQKETLREQQHMECGEKIRVTKLLQLWQQIFEEASRRFQELFSKIDDDQTNEQVLNLWNDHLENVREYLLTKVPDSFENLNYDLQINRSESLENTMAEAKSTINVIADLHAEILSDIKKRRELVERKFDEWQRYRQNHRNLLSWLRDVETKQSKLNLGYVPLRTIDNVLEETKHLINQIPTGITLANELRDQQDELLTDCSTNICKLVRAELDADYKQIQNLDAALRTWHEFLENIKSVIELHREEVHKIEKMFEEIHSRIEQMINCRLESSAWVDLQENLNTIKEFDEALASMDAEFNKLIDFEEKLKGTADIKDVKTIKQKHWSLKKEQKELRYQLSIYALQFEEKLALREHFNDRCANFLTWCNEMKDGEEEFFLKTYSPEEIIQSFENEFCAEVRQKEEEYNWLIKTHALLSGTEFKKEIFKQESNLSTGIDNIRVLWIEVNDKTIRKVEKIQKLLKEMEDLTKACDELNEWIHKTEVDLKKVTPFSHSDDAALQEKLDEYEAIYKKIERKNSEVSRILKRGERLMAEREISKIPLDSNSFVVTMDQIKKGWISLQAICAKKEDNILTGWDSLKEVSRLCNTCESWLNEQEKKIDSWKKRSVAAPFQSDFAKEIQILSAEMNNSSIQFKQLEEQYNNLLAKNYVRDLVIVRETLSRYKKLRTVFQELRSSENDNLQNWEEFQSLHVQLVLKLSQLDALLAQLQIKDEGSGKSEKSVDVYEKKFEKLLKFESEHKLLKKSVRHVESIKLKLMTDDKNVNVNTVQKMGAEYVSMHRKLKRRIQLLKKFYSNKKLSLKTVENTSTNEEVQVETLKFEKDFASQVDTLSDSFQKLSSFHSELQNSVRESRNNIETLAELLNSDNTDKLPNIIASCRSSIDLVRHLSVLMESQRDKKETVSVLDSVKELEAMFQQLLSRIHYQQQSQIIENGGVDRERCPFCLQQNWSPLNDNINRLEDWLNDMDVKLQKSTFSFPENVEQMENIIQNQKEFLVCLDNHRDFIVTLNIIEKHLNGHCQNEEQILELRKRIMRVNEKWEKFSSQSFIWHTKFGATYFEDDRFRTIITKLLDKIENAEHSIANHTPTDFPEKKMIVQQKYNKLKNLYEELKECEPRVTSLLAIHQVYNSQKITNLENSLNELSHLRLRLQSLIRVSRIYITTLEERLNRDTSTQLLSAELDSRDPEIPSEKFLEDIVNEPMEHANLRKSNLSNSGGEYQGIISSQHRFFTRVTRTSFPIQIILFLTLGTVLFFTSIEDEFSCSIVNNLAWSFEPILRYPNGPPPT